MVRIEKAEKVNIDTAEVLRYLGYGKSNADESVLSIIEKCKDEMIKGCSLKACYDEFALAFDQDRLAFGNIETTSKSLKKNLKDCERVIVFAATIGIETDRIIGRYSLTSPANAVVAQAVGAVMIESWCDVLCERFAEWKKESNMFLRPRFSPGYGDFSIDFQKNIFQLLDCSRKIGVTLSDSCQMMPSKSVSAIVGISRVNTRCHKNGCEVCNKTECGYRRG